MIAEVSPICLNILILRIIYFAKLFITVLRFLIPIILIIMIIADLYKQMVNQDEKEGVKSVKNRLIAAIIIFIIPTIVNIIIGLLDKTISNNSVGLSTCIKFSNNEYIAELQKLESDEEYLKEIEEFYLKDEEKSLSDFQKKALAAERDIDANRASAVDEADNTSENTNIDLSKRVIAGQIKCDGDRSSYNAALKTAVDKAGRKTRAGVVAAAKYLANDIGVSIPYFWSGGHFHNFKDSKGQRVSDEGDNFKGIHKKWGCSVKMSGKGTDMQKHGQLYPFGLDCSGFVAWAIYNGGYGSSSEFSFGVQVSELKSLGGETVTSIKLSNPSVKGRVKAGDLVHRNGHVGMIIEVRNDLLLVAEEKGYKYGLVISEIKYTDTKKFSNVVLMDNFYNNYKKGESTW